MRGYHWVTAGVTLLVMLAVLTARLLRVEEQREKPVLIGDQSTKLSPSPRPNTGLIPRREGVAEATSAGPAVKITLPGSRYKSPPNTQAPKTWANSLPLLGEPGSLERVAQEVGQKFADASVRLIEAVEAQEQRDRNRANAAELQEGQSYQGMIELKRQVNVQGAQNVDQLIADRKNAFRLDIKAPDPKGGVVTEIRIAGSFFGVLKSDGPPQPGQPLILRGELSHRAQRDLAPPFAPTEMKLNCNDAGLSGSFHIQYLNFLFAGTGDMIEDWDLKAKRVPSIVGMWKGVQNITEILEFRSDGFVQVKENEKEEGKPGVYVVKSHLAMNDGSYFLNMKINGEGGPITRNHAMLFLSEPFLVLEGQKFLIYRRMLKGEALPRSHDVPSYKNGIVGKWKNVWEPPKAGLTFHPNGMAVVDEPFVDDALEVRGQNPAGATNGIYTVAGDDLALTFSTQRGLQDGPPTIRLTIMAMDTNRMMLIARLSTGGLTRTKSYLLEREPSAQ
jgi:hypothetical protein